MHPNRPLVSMVLVTYNSAELLPPFFSALAATAYSPYELIVVDNASDDGTVPYLASEKPGITTITAESNLGFGRACNRGAAVARGDFVVFLNPDVAVTPRWLDILVCRMDEHQDAAIVSPTTLAPGQPARESIVPAVEVAAVPGCAMMVRRSAWEALGGFDEQIFMYWEDTELCWRASLMGWRVLEDLQAQVYHARGATTGGRDWDAELIKNGLYTYLKLMRWRQVVPFAACLVAKTAVKFALNPRRALLDAWVWNARHLRTTRAFHRSLSCLWRADPSGVEQRIAAHARRLRRERRQRTHASQMGRS